MSYEIDEMNTFVQKFVDTWNRHNANEFASLFIDDGEWTDVIGHYVKGKDKIEPMHIYQFESVLKDATLTITFIRSGRIRNDIVIIDANWKTTGNKPLMERHYQQDM